MLWGRGALIKGDPLNIIDDQFRTPTLAEDLAQACQLAIEKRALGVYHVSGNDYMSILEMVQRMADFYHCDQSIINRISTDSLNQKAKRPPKTGFILDKAMKQLGYQPHTFEEGLAIVEHQILKQEIKPIKMKQIATLLSLMLSSKLLLAQTLSDQINNFFEPIVAVMAKVIFWDPIAALGFELESSIPIVVVWLVFGALFFTLKMNFINIRGFKHAIELVRGKFDDPKDQGEVSHFHTCNSTFCYCWIGEYCWCCGCYHIRWSRSYLLDDCSWTARNVFKICRMYF